MSATFFCCGSNGKCASKTTVSGDSPVFPVGWSVLGMLNGKVGVLCPVCTRQRSSIETSFQDNADKQKKEQDIQKARWRVRFNALQSELEQLRREILG